MTSSVHQAESNQSVQFILADLDSSRKVVQLKHRVMCYSVLANQNVLTLNTIFQMEGAVTAMDWWGER